MTKLKKRTKKEQKRFDEVRARILQNQKDNPDPLFREWSVDSKAGLIIALSSGPSPENRNIEREDFVTVLCMMEEAINALFESRYPEDADLRKDWRKKVAKYKKKYGLI